MPIMRDVAPRDQKKPVTVHCVSPYGEKFPVAVEVYLNRVTQEPVSDERVRAYCDSHGILDGDAPDSVSMTSLRNALAFCDVVAKWDMDGPWSDADGKELVGEGQMIPLDPLVVRTVPAWVTGQINDRVLELVFPNLRRSTRSR